MQVPAFLIQVQFGLIAHKKLMASVANIDGRGIDLITVAKMDAVEVTAN